jgi:hypothetical protein
VIVIFIIATLYYAAEAAWDYFRTQELRYAVIAGIDVSGVAIIIHILNWQRKKNKERSAFLNTLDESQFVGVYYPEPEHATFVPSLERQIAEKEKEAREKYFSKAVEDETETTHND